MAEKKEEVGGLTDNTAAALSYVLGVVSGIVFLAVRSGDQYVRFHAIQSIGLCALWIIGWIVLAMIPIVGWILMPFWWLVLFAFWLVAIVKAYQGEKFLLPVVGAYFQSLGKKLGL